MNLSMLAPHAILVAQASACVLFRAQRLRPKAHSLNSLCAFSRRNDSNKNHKDANKTTQAEACATQGYVPM